MEWWWIGIVLSWLVLFLRGPFLHFYHRQPYRLVWRKGEPTIQEDEWRGK